jgi:hypothetical protein
MRRLLETFRHADTLLALSAVINAVHMSWMAASVRGCEWVCPWYAGGIPWRAWPPDSIWTFAPTRLLVAAVCLRARRTWADALALVVAAQIVVGNLLFTLNPDQFAADLRLGPTVFETPALQALLAGLVGVVASLRIVRRVGGGRVSASFRTAVPVIAALLVIGYASNLVSHAAAEREVARFVSGEVLHGSRFYVLTDADFDLFRDVKAPVTKGQYGDEPHAMMGWTSFVAPFVLETHWDYTGGRDDSRMGWVLTVGFFGKTFIARRDGPFWGWRTAWVFYPG